MSLLAKDEDGERRVVLDGRALGAEGWDVGWPLAMTADAGVVAYQLTHRTTGKSCIAVNGVQGPEFDAVGTPVLSADGSVVAYRAESGDDAFVVVGDRRGPTFDLVKDPALTPDGRSVAYGASRADRWFLVLDDERTPIEHEPLYLFVGPEPRFVGYAYLESSPAGGSFGRVVVGEHVGEPFALVGRPTFGPDGAHFAYAASRDGRAYIVIDDREFEVAGRTSDPVFGADGATVGYGTRIDRELWWKVLEIPP